MEIARQVLSVLLVFALLAAALWALRRAGPVSLRGRFRGAARQSGGHVKSLRSLERLVLSPQHSLHLIEINGRQLLVAVHPQGCTLLRVDAEGASA
jgi:flagellar biogenesis protein FliO